MGRGTPRPINVPQVHCNLIHVTLWYMVWVCGTIPAQVRRAVGVGLIGMLFQVAYTQFIIFAIYRIHRTVESLIYVFI